MESRHILRVTLADLGAQLPAASEAANRTNKVASLLWRHAGCVLELLNLACDLTICQLLLTWALSLRPSPVLLKLLNPAAWLPC